MGVCPLLRYNSVIFIQNTDETPKVRTGDYLVHLTHELEKFGSLSYIEEFVSCGPKIHAFFLFSAPRKEKVRTSVK